MKKRVTKIKNTTIKKAFTKPVGGGSKGINSQEELFVRGYQDTIKFLNSPIFLTSK